MCKIWNPSKNVQNMKPVQYAQVLYFAHFLRLFFFNFEINGYFHFFFLIYYYYLFYFFLGGGGGILEDFIIEIV